MNEVSILRVCNSPYIVPFFDTFEDNEQIYIVQEFIEGESLSEMLNKCFLNEKQCRKLCYSIFKGLIYLQKMGIAHRDIKQDNIMLCYFNGKALP